MSIHYKLHEDNKVWIYEIEEMWLRDYFTSHHKDEIILTDAMISKLDILDYIKSTIEVILTDLGLVDDVKVSSAVRTWQTHLQIYAHLNKYRKVKLKVPKDSQHLHFEAIDLHFYKDGKRIEGKDLAPIYETIVSTLGDSFVQILSYSWGIHIGLATSRTKVKFARRRP